MLIRPPTFARGGMVAASEPLAAAAGLEMLRRGGHAVDAAIAAGAVLSVIEPSASGLGGDAFLLIAAGGRVEALNGSGAAPADLDRSRFAGLARVPILGPLSATVPGAPAAWAAAHERWGRLPWSDVWAPAVTLAALGFPVSLKLARSIRLHREVVAANPGLRSLYLTPEGRPLGPGELCRPTALAETLATIAREGVDPFYRGPIGDRLARGAQAAGGAISAPDLAAHVSEWTTPYPLRLEDDALGSLTVHEQPLPSQGVLLLFMLGLLDAADRRVPATRPWEELHRQVEAKKVAFAMKELLLSDPRTLPFDAREMVTELLAPGTLEAMSTLLLSEPLPPGLERSTVASLLPEGLRRFTRELEGAGIGGGEPGGEGTDTTYLCTVDAEGNAVGMIQSVFHPWGGGFLEPSTGILLNNRAVGFSLDPRHVNRLEPGKRTLHTLNSYLIERNGGAWLVAGTPGGDNQVQTNLQVVRHLLAGHSTWPSPAPMVPGRWSQARLCERARLPEAEYLAAALEAPRWRHDAEGRPRVRIEARMAAEIRKRLERRGHEVERIGPWEGSGYVQAILFSEHAGTLIGATDPRGEGAALGL